MASSIARGKDDCRRYLVTFNVVASMKLQRNRGLDLRVPLRLLVPLIRVGLTSCRVPAQPAYAQERSYHPFCSNHALAHQCRLGCWKRQRRLPMESLWSQ